MYTSLSLLSTLDQGSRCGQELFLGDEFKAQHKVHCTALTLIVQYVTMQNLPSSKEEIIINLSSSSFLFHSSAGRSQGKDLKIIEETGRQNHGGGRGGGRRFKLI